MKIVLSESLIEFLGNNKIEYEIIGILKEKYQIASLFETVANGFYFFNGIDLHKTLVDSLILVEEKFNKNIDCNSNSFIIIQGDSQLVFYKFLEFQFTEKSTGTIEKSAIIHPEAKIGKNVQIDHFCIIGKCEIGNNVIIRNNCKIHDNTKIGNDTLIESYSDIGTRGLAWIWNEQGNRKIVQPQLGSVAIGKNCILASNTIVVRGSLNESTLVGDHTMFAPGCRLGHGTQIGKFVHFANNIVTGGNAIIGDYSFVGSSAVFRSKVKIDNYTIVGSGAVVVKNTSGESLTIMGNPAREYETKNNPSGMPKPINKT